ncbi:A/G-specific adenine glycosylase [Anaerorhabdus sp.]|uniref:A/G-specific adenine glycosylase n=1 Tax=Anaerorhabdus sp. TaxID=1872524 RepID=UPI002B216F3D|nr:A/G-specific adenine glycosylase [Anaerorhabdus sp.]MEA4873929.1 A/G-specific adenine glycosylase [Anaerorhabdus sp.]
MKVSEKIEDWYRANYRDLPFRKTSDPYAIWVSEIMAQQTRIDTMLPYYETWMNKWPTIEKLAQADLQEVLKVWQGLGYYNRARKLHQGAITVMENYGGIIPNDPDEIQRIEGIGDYTAGAILSIAFGEEVPAVDGNVFRVITRYFALADDITKISTRRKVTEICKTWMKDSNPSHFTQGLMEIGAMVCTPKKPMCSLCPLQDECMAHELGVEENYPVKSKMKAPRELEVYTYVFVCKDEICLSSDDSDGLMRDYYRLPQFDSRYNIQGEELKKRKHVFSHLIWHMNCFLVFMNKKIELDKCAWVKMKDVHDYPMVTAHKKLLKDLSKLPELHQLNV